MLKDIPWDAAAILTGGIHVPESEPMTLREAVMTYLRLPPAAKVLAGIMSAEPVNGTQFFSGRDLQDLVDRLNDMMDR